MVLIDEGFGLFRLSKLADYGIVIMTGLARRPDQQFSAADIAQDSAIPQPTVSKILKMLARADLLTSHRGAKGGYGLSRPGSEITVAEVITAIEGPIALTACIDEGAGACDIESLCPARANWQRINDAIKGALDGINIEEMALTIPEAFKTPIETKTSIKERSAETAEIG